MAGAAEHHDAAAPPTLPDPTQVHDRVAEEILRQAQKLIETQIAASTALDAKLNAVVQQCITLTLAALAGAASAFVQGAWLPVAAAIGLMAAALLWSVAAGMAVQGLNTSEIDAPARRPRRLWRAGIADIGVVRGFALIAAELDDSFARNSQRATATAARYKAALTLMIRAPIAGAAIALAYAALSAWWWPVPILLILLPALSPGLWRRCRLWMRRPEGFDDDIRADRVAGEGVE
jgi:hypothetical protein